MAMRSTKLRKSYIITAEYIQEMTLLFTQVPIINVRDQVANLLEFYIIFLGVSSAKLLVGQTSRRRTIRHRLNVSSNFRRQNVSGLIDLYY